MKYHQSNKQKHDDRTSVLSKLEDKYNYDGLTFPVSYDDITKFEDNNKVCIFVYYINDQSEIHKERNGNVDYYNKDLVYLLRVENDTHSHFVYIKHISKLLNLSTHKDDCNKRFCPFCEAKVNFGKFDRHISSCYKIAKEGTILKMPEEGSVMKFKNYRNTLERPFLATFDCEATLVKTNDEHKIHKHVVNSCCYHFDCSFDSTRNYLKTFVGDNCLVDMIKDLMELEVKCYKEMSKNEKMVLTDEDRINFKNANTCYLCKEPFDENKNALCKVRDHDHRTGKYRGAAHGKCNINYRHNRYLPVVCHNLRGYDGHLIIRKAFEL
jgi:hypothetical protein